MLPRVIKSNGNREPFAEEKLRAGMVRALEKRPVQVDHIETAIAHIKRDLLARGEREVESRFIGDLVMHELRRLDQVAYIRFASVYLSFEDLDAFREVIDRLKRNLLRKCASTRFMAGNPESEAEYGTISPSLTYMFDALDHHYMARALQLAIRGLYTTQPNPRVGCVLGQK